MTDSTDARATARQHTAQLLKMLRGHGPTDPQPVLPPVVPAPDQRANTVAEAPPTYPDVPAPTRKPRKTSGARSGHDATPTVPRQPTKLRTISPIGETLFRQKGVLGELMQRAEHLVKLTRIFRAYLPPHLHDHATLIRLDAEEWVVHTDSSSWATRLRYALHNIRETLGQQLGIELPKPYIRVVPPEVPVRKPRPPMKLTKRSAKVLEIAARNQSDERLSAALRKLAARAHPPS